MPYFVARTEDRPDARGRPADMVSMVGNTGFATREEAERSLGEARARAPGTYRIIEAGTATEALMRSMTAEDELRITVKVIETQQEMDYALSIRRRVFIEEQGVTEAEEVDEHDADPAEVTSAVHVLGRLEGTQMPIATARLLLPLTLSTSTGGGHPHIGRVAVLREFRGLGFGRAVIEALHAEARALGFEGVTLAAQLEAIPFYARLGYVARGDIFLDARIEHRWMDVRL